MGWAHTHWASLQKLNELVSNDAGRRCKAVARKRLEDANWPVGEPSGNIVKNCIKRQFNLHEKKISREQVWQCRSTGTRFPRPGFQVKRGQLLLLTQFRPTVPTPGTRYPQVKYGA
jgi:hypothetical protein